MTKLTPGLAKSRGGFDDTDYRIWAICRNRSALCRQNSPTRVLAPQAARSARRAAPRAASAGGFTNHRSAWKVAPQATPATAPSWKVAPQAWRALLGSSDDGATRETHGWARHFGASHRRFAGKRSQGHAWAWMIIISALSGQQRRPDESTTHRHRRRRQRCHRRPPRRRGGRPALHLLRRSMLRRCCHALLPLPTRRRRRCHRLQWRVGVSHSPTAGRRSPKRSATGSTGSPRQSPRLRGRAW